MKDKYICIIKQTATHLQCLKKVPRDWKTATVAIQMYIKKVTEVQGIQLPPCFPHMCPMQMYGTHCGQPGNATSYQEQYLVQPPAWLQIQSLLAERWEVE